jgi:hypothetical protein
MLDVTLTFNNSAWDHDVGQGISIRKHPARGPAAHTTSLGIWVRQRIEAVQLVTVWPTKPRCFKHKYTPKRSTNVNVAKGLARDRFAHIHERDDKCTQTTISDVPGNDSCSKKASKVGNSGGYEDAPNQSKSIIKTLRCVRCEPYHVRVRPYRSVLNLFSLRKKRPLTCSNRRRGPIISKAITILLVAPAPESLGLRRHHMTDIAHITGSMIMDFMNAGWISMTSERVCCHDTYPTTGINHRTSAISKS